MHPLFSRGGFEPLFDFRAALAPLKVAPFALAARAIADFQGPDVRFLAGGVAIRPLHVAARCCLLPPFHSNSTIRLIG